MNLAALPFAEFCIHRKQQFKLGSKVMKRPGKSKSKAVPLQASTGPQGSRKLKFPDYVTTAEHGGKVVRLKPPLPPGNIPGTHFC